MLLIARNIEYIAKRKIEKKALTGNDAERQSMVVIKKIGSFQNQVTLGFKKHKLSASLAAQLDSSGKKRLSGWKKRFTLQQYQEKIWFIATDVCLAYLRF